MCRVAIGYLYIRGCMLLIEGNCVVINGELLRHSAIAFNLRQRTALYFPSNFKCSQFYNFYMQTRLENVSLTCLVPLCFSFHTFIVKVFLYNTKMYPQKYTSKYTSKKIQPNKNKINHQNHRPSQALVCGIQKKGINSAIISICKQEKHLSPKVYHLIEAWYNKQWEENVHRLEYFIRINQN